LKNKVRVIDADSLGKRFCKFLILVCALSFIIGFTWPEKANADIIRNGIVFPLDEPIMVGKRIVLTAWYSFKRADMGGREYHAWNLPAREGSDVLASFSGQVISICYKRFEGNCIVIAYDNGITLGYCHIGSYVVHAGYKQHGKYIPGQRVAPGDLIGYVGRTGRTTGSHLRIVNINSDNQPVFIGPATFGMNYKTDFYYMGGMTKDELRFEFL